MNACAERKVGIKRVERRQIEARKRETEERTRLGCDKLKREGIKVTKNKNKETRLGGCESPNQINDASRVLQPPRGRRRVTQMT